MKGIIYSIFLLILVTVVGCKKNDNAGKAVVVSRESERVYEGVIADTAAKRISEITIVSCEYSTNRSSALSSIEVVVPNIVFSDMVVGQKIYFSKTIITENKFTSSPNSICIGTMVFNVDTTDSNIIRIPK